MIYDGARLVDGEVAIGPVAASDLRRVVVDEVAEPSMRWIDRAIANASCLYFGIFLSERLVGQIFLHDISADRREALIGYHLFTPEHRGRGIGTRALRLLQRLLATMPDLRTAVIITSRDNLPSQRLAQRCGFRHRGAPREDPNGMVFTWSLCRGGT